MSDNIEPKFVSAVVYIHNNASEIETKLAILDSELAKFFEQYEIICVNDASSDDGIEKIKLLSSSICRGGLTVINLSFYHGLEAAMNAGIDLSIGDFVYEFDTLSADFPLDAIWDVYSRCLQGYDIVSAGPQKNPRLSSRIYYQIFNKAMGSKYVLEYDIFRIVTRRAINRVHSMSKSIPYRKALYANCGLKMDYIHYAEIKVNKDDRSVKEKSHFAFNSLILFTNTGYKIAFVLSIVMMILAVFIAVYVLVLFFGSGHPIEGWTSTMLFMSICFFGIFALLGFVLKYSSTLVDLVFNKQKYFIESVEKIVNRR